MRNVSAKFFLTTACLLLSIFFTHSLQAKEAVDVELVLLSDASNSIDNAEIKFQRQGYATAMTHPDVIAAIRKGDLGKIAVTFIEWGDDNNQETVVPWMVVKDNASAETFAKALFARERLAYGSNAIGAALAAAHRQIDQNKYEGHRKVIDLSGDSANNWNGIPIAEARGKALKAGIIINGLAILCRSENCGGRPVNYNLEQAFAQRIIGGPGSFVVTVDSPARFAQAVRSKLILELASLPANLRP
ncbi:MAG: DUF1194 domain-containing protein [Pseudomonadota bacterium]